MSIRIYNEGLSGAGAAPTGRTQEVSRAITGGSHSSSSPAGGEDQVQISSLSEGLSAQSSQHSARVQSLKALYQSGRYQVDSASVSRAIVSQALGSGKTESGA